MFGIRRHLQELLWYIEFLKKKKYKQPYINQYSGRCCVLANGPSLKDALAKYDAGELEITSDSVMVNLAAIDDHFWKIKPKHMVFSDILFCQDFTPRKEQVRKQYELLNEKVDWDINFYLCYDNPQHVEMFKSYSKLTNPKIHFVPMNRIYLNNWPRKYWKRMLDSGYFMPMMGTVVNPALHVALLSGYKQIELYGADSNWFLDFYMADDGHLNLLEKHFYDEDGEQKMKPFLSPYNNGGNKYSSQCMGTLYCVFKSCEIHAWWAKQIGAQILNCSPDSMIDAFNRIGRDGKIHPCPYEW